MKALVIYNLKAGSGKAANFVEDVKKNLLKYNINADLFFTEYKGHATEIVKNANLLSFDSVITVGGDGTFYESLNGYFQNKNREGVKFGVLPIGTGNSLSRDIYDKEYSLEKHIEILSKGKTIPFDIAKFKTEGQEKYFANTLGFGFTSDVIATSLKFKFLGDFAYTIGIMHRMLMLSTSKMKLTVDGTSYDMKSVLISISNSRYTGGNYLIAPDAKINDGLLDVVILHKLSRFNLIKTFLKIFTGEHVNTKFVQTMQAKNISIETHKPKVLAPDGELLGKTPFSVECIKGGINMIVN